MLILYNSFNLLHKIKTKTHPQRPQRIIQLIQHLKSTPYLPFIQQLNTVLNLKQNQNLSIKLNQIAKQQIIKLHGQRYYDFVQGMWCEGISKDEMFINLDTYYMKQTFTAAFEAVKTCVYAVENSLGLDKKTKVQQKNQQKEQQKENRDYVCLVRPPGHHSGMKNQPHGFSFFNNVAIAANYFTQKTKKNAVIIDWDIHHGEGTQKIFYDRYDVLYISLHRFDNGDFFPHIKQSNCSYLGQKQGEGYNINICWNFPSLNSKNQGSKSSSSSENRKPSTYTRMPDQTVTNKQYIYCFQKIIIPILKQYQFQGIFISCGFDCAQGDPIGESKIDKKGFEQMTKMLKQQFDKNIYVVLEGGYNIQTLKWGVEGVLEGLESRKAKKQKKQQGKDNLKDKQNKKTQTVQFQDLNVFAQKDIQTAVNSIKKYWKI